MDNIWCEKSGNVGVWFMNGATIVKTAVLGHVPLTWTIAVTGDYSADGGSDILWAVRSGNVAVWYKRHHLVLGCDLRQRRNEPGGPSTTRRVVGAAVTCRPT
jgi:hypothetical protein